MSDAKTAALKQAEVEQPALGVTLSWLGRRHAEKVALVSLIAKLDDRYRWLRLDHESVTKQVDTLSDTDNAGLAALFRREGT